MVVSRLTGWLSPPLPVEKIAARAGRFEISNGCKGIKKTLNLKRG
jgi:hypothetical protein